MSVKPKVLVAVALDVEAMKHLKEVADVDVVEESAIGTKEGLLKIIGNYEGAIVSLPPFSRDVLSQAKRLKVISRCGVGYETIDVKAAKERGIYVTITPVLSETVAEMAFALLLAAARRIPQAHIYIKNGQWRRRTDRSYFQGVDVFGKTLGIIGLGRIGSAVAKIGKGFGLKLLYNDIIRYEKLEKELGIEYRPFNQLLSEADFISVNVPLTEKTRGLIGAKELETMKKTAILVNTSRGPVIDEKALYKALNGGLIAAAGLDVFENEPIEPDNPLLTLDNVVLAPHVAGTTLECRHRIDMLAVENVVHVLKGGTPIYQVTQ